MGQATSCWESVTFTSEPPVLNSTNLTVQCGQPWSFTPPAVISDTCCGSNVAVGLIASNIVTMSACTNIYNGIWGATNCCGLTGTCTQTVTVVDTTPPTILGCSNILVYTCCTNLAVPWNVTATDNCGSVTVSCSPPLGTYFASGTTNWVSVVAEDACGNTNTCGFLVTVLKTQLTVSITGTNTITLSWPGDGVLQKADDLRGGWTDVLSASSPYPAIISAQQRFYRLRCP